jgi:ABC-type thiamine transport system ATPase subunit
LIEFTDVTDSGLGPFSLRVPEGLSVFIADSESALQRLVELAAGRRSPKRGRVLVDGHDLRAEPSARSKIAALLPEEDLLLASSVRESLSLSLSLQGSSTDARQVLESADLAGIGELPPTALDARSRRAVALALALASANARAFILADPFSAWAHLPRAAVVNACRELSARAAVLITVRELSDAMVLGGSLRLVERGRLSSVEGLMDAAGVTPHLLVRSERAVHLAEPLARALPGLEVLFDEQRSSRELYVRGARTVDLARAVTRVAQEQGVALEALSPATPPLAYLLGSRRSASLALQRTSTPLAKRPIFGTP